MPPESKKPGPVGAGRRLKIRSLQTKQSATKARPSTAAIVADYLGAALYLAVVTERARRIHLRNARRQHRAAVHRVDVLTEEITANQKATR